MAGQSQAVRTVNSGFTRNTVPSSPPLVSGYGAVVRDIHDKEYIDCCSQTLNMNLGQCHPEVVDAVVKQARTLTYASSRFSSDVAEALTHKLVQITPAPLTTVNLKNVSGSSANECAVKAARKQSGKQLIVSIRDSHLGQTLEMMRISGKHWNLSYLKGRDARFLPSPYCFRCPVGQKPDSCGAECLDPLDEIWKQDGNDIAAVMLEPIMVDAGVLAPPKVYHTRLREFCSRRNIALIYDEVQTGFGWMGWMFAMDYYGITPDIVSFGKGFSGGFPLAATMFSPAYDVLHYGEHEITYGAHPLSCAASLATIAYLERVGLREAADKGVYARTRLDAIARSHPAIADVRGVGLLMGIEIADPRDGSPDSTTAKRIYETMLEHGVILRVSKAGKQSNVLQFKPPIVITHQQLDTVFDKFEQVLRTAGV